MDDSLLDWDNIADAHCSPAEPIANYPSRLENRLQYSDDEVNEAFAKLGLRTDYYEVKNRRLWRSHDKSRFWKTLEEYEEMTTSDEQKMKLDNRIVNLVAVSAMNTGKKCSWVHAFLGIISLQVSEINPVKEEACLDDITMDVTKANFEKTIEKVFFASTFLAEASRSERDMWNLIQRSGLVHVWRIANQVVTAVYQATWEAVRTQSVRHATCEEVLAKTMCQLIRECELELQKRGVGALHIANGKEDFRIIRACIKEGDLSKEMRAIKRYAQTFRVSTTMRWNEANWSHKTFIPKRTLLTLKFHIRTRIQRNMRN